MSHPTTRSARRAPQGARPRDGMRRALLAAAMLLLGGLVSPASAQPVPQPVRPPAVSDTVWQVQLSDGSTVIGRVVSVQGERFTLETTTGVRVELSPTQVRRIEPLRGRIVNGEAWFDDPNVTRLFFSPTGRALEAGEGYFSVFQLFLPFVSYGITDRITISGGTPILPEVIGRVFYLAPKVTIVDAPTTQLAAGVFALFATGLDADIDLGTAGLLYGVGTFGTRDRAATIGAAWPFYAASGESEIGNDPLLMFGAETRVSRRVKLITENYFVLGASGGVLSGGARFFGERLSADAGLGLGYGDGGGFCCVPLVNFVYNF
jgi:hypothetical protein